PIGDAVDGGGGPHADGEDGHHDDGEAGRPEEPPEGETEVPAGVAQSSDGTSGPVRIDSVPGFRSSARAPPPHDPPEDRRERLPPEPPRRRALSERGRTRPVLLEQIAFDELPRLAPNEEAGQPPCEPGRARARHRA